MSGLSHIRIVLMETSHPGNIGAAARAMKTMGLTRLVLVKPGDYPHADATARASGAQDLLTRAVVTDSLTEALEDCVLVIGTSARERSLRWPALELTDCAAMSRKMDGEVALVFGRERTGLTNDELDRCHYVTHIPSNPEYCSLNLASAVQLVGYELRRAQPELATATDRCQAAPVGEPLAEVGDLEQFYAHLERTLVELDFLDPDNPKQLMRRLRRLYGRAWPSQNEVNILRGILTACQRRTAANS